LGKECLRHYGRAWYRKNAVKHRARNRWWKKQHPDRAREHRQRWREDHAERVRESDARKVNFHSKRVHCPVQLRRGVCSRYGYRRKRGERQLPLHYTYYDHRHPERWTLEVCWKCHSWLHRHAIRKVLNADGTPRTYLIDPAAKRTIQPSYLTMDSTALCYNAATGRDTIRAGHVLHGGVAERSKATVC
jgi:hypothetical protein